MLPQPPREPLSEAGRGDSDEPAIQVLVSDRSKDCNFRQAEGGHGTIGSMLIFAYFCSATKVGPAERKRKYHASPPRKELEKPQLIK